MKKAFCILTAILLLLTAMIPVSAIEEVEPQAACQHDFVLQTATPYYENKNREKHYLGVQTVDECRLCGFVIIQILPISEENHEKIYTHAECNGTTQTHTRKCKYCHASFTETIRCPNAPHGLRPCVALPLRQIFEIA